jgi:hypothetical protein
MELLEQGEKAGLVRLDGERKVITYVAAGKRQRYTDPEEQVRAEAYLQLIFDYGYEAKLRQFLLRLNLQRATSRSRAAESCVSDDGWRTARGTSPPPP